MKTMIVTTPIRPVPSRFPPIGSLNIINYARKNGYGDIEFYNVDAIRPDYNDVIKHIKNAAPDILGISAVVSTAYEYTKRLSIDVKKMLPDTLIVMGGSLGASAEVLLRKTGIDLCVLGEGEKVFLNILRKAENTLNPFHFDSIPGLVLLDENGKLKNTGYGTTLKAEEMYEIEWSDLLDESNLDIFFPLIDNAGDGAWTRMDPRCLEEKRQGKRHALLPGAKGCVARCTFCHRWEKGIRYIPVDIVMRRLDYVIKHFNTGYLTVADENFGTDRKWLQEFCQKIKDRDVLWRVAGMRVNCITPEQLKMMKAAGCISVLFGMETGSARMLEVMEKKTKVEDNYNAMTWMAKEGLWTGVQLVLGMPGENQDTINETIEFCKYSLTLNIEQNPNDLSINYAQALPGTPLYEYGRHHSLIGQTLDQEEEYLLKISDKDAHDETTTINFTDSPRLVTRSWRTQINVHTNYAYVKKFGLAAYHAVLLTDTNYFRTKQQESGYFANPKRLVETAVMVDSVQTAIKKPETITNNKPPPLFRLLKNRRLGLALICYPILAYRFRHLIWLMVLVRSMQTSGLKGAWDLLEEYIFDRLLRLVSVKRFRYGYRSLRKIVDQDLPKLAADVPEMEMLRRGR